MNLAAYCIHGNDPNMCCECRDHKRITELESALAKSASREAALVEKLKVAEEALVLFKFYGDTPKLKATAIEALAKIKEASNGAV